MPVITGLNSTNLFSCIPPVIDNVSLATGPWRNTNIALWQREGKRVWRWGEN